MKERRRAHPPSHKAMAGQVPNGAGKKLEIKQFRYSPDNLGYLICSEQNAVAVDGGAAEDILFFLQSNNLSLKYVTNTHSHGDHTVGNNDLLNNTNAQYFDYHTLINNGFSLDNQPVDVFKTPGHTADSVIFKIDNTLLTGDTLFIGKVGRCFSGDTKGFLESIKLILDFPDDSVIYPGHDYVLEYMEFDRKIDADNQYIDEMLAGYNPEHVKSSLGMEKKINPFLKINDQKIISLLDKQGLPAKTEYDRWQSMMSLM